LLAATVSGALLEAVLQCRYKTWYSIEPVRRESGNAAEEWHEQAHSLYGSGSSRGLRRWALRTHWRGCHPDDPWPEHIEYIKHNGIHLSGTQGEHTVRLKALHLHEVQSLFKEPVDIAFICTKSYDTEWATMMIKQYLAPDGFVVSLQNSINEERIANIVGWGKVVGCIASTIGVDAYKAGHVMRTRQAGGSTYTIFRVGEVHGRITPRVQDIVRMLSVIDSAKATTNLWGERWGKLTQNSMGNGISACTGMNSKAMTEWETSRRLSIRLAGEAIKVGQALGYEIEPISKMPSDKWVAASEGDPAALEEIEGVMLDGMKRMTEEGRPSTGQDMLKGRRTEIEFLNGLVAAKGEEVGIPAPTHAALTEVVKRVERGEIEAHPRNVEKL
jgi:2-dehydropantoate 2-reductase